MTLPRSWEWMEDTQALEFNDKPYWPSTLVSCFGGETSPGDTTDIRRAWGCGQ